MPGTEQAGHESSPSLSWPSVSVGISNINPPVQSLSGSSPLPRQCLGEIGEQRAVGGAHFPLLQRPSWDGFGVTDPGLGDGGESPPVP